MQASGSCACWVLAQWAGLQPGDASAHSWPAAREQRSSMVKGYETLVGSGEHGHDRGWSVARMIASRAAATRMVDMIVKVDRWSPHLGASMATGRLGDLANRDHQCYKFAALSLAKDLTDPFAEGGQIGTRWE